MTKRILVVQHAPFETPGILSELLAAAGYETQTVHSAAGDVVPADCEDAAALIVMGGPMGVYEAEEFPYLRDEMRLIERAFARNMPVLGVCLGSQLLAAALGARVTKGATKEIGWYPVTLTDEARKDSLWRDVTSPLTCLHWHGDIFELPRAAVSLASSERTACQAFRYGERAYGFLMHAEVTPEIVEGMLEAFAAELKRENLKPETIRRATSENLPALNGIARTVFSRWVKMIAEPAAQQRGAG
jgi:GMP synthase (glutamine-hydrolysing)